MSSVASYLLLLPLAAVGARAWWRGGRRPEALFLLAASAVIVGLVFFPQERFRIPVIDPALIVCAAVACADARKQRLRPARGKRVFERRSASEWGWGPTSK